MSLLIKCSICLENTIHQCIHNDSCNQCKIKLIKNSYNKMTKSLPIEIQNLIFDYVNITNASKTTFCVRCKKIICLKCAKYYMPWCCLCIGHNIFYN